MGQEFEYPNLVAGTRRHRRMLNAGAKGATVDYRMRLMLVEGTTPAAWAPAEGEELADGRCVHER